MYWIRNKLIICNAMVIVLFIFVSNRIVVCDFKGFWNWVQILMVEVFFKSIQVAKLFDVYYLDDHHV